MLKIKNDGNRDWFIATSVATEIESDRAPQPGQPEVLAVGETLVLRTEVELEVSLTRDTIQIKRV